MYHFTNLIVTTVFIYLFIYFANVFFNLNLKSLCIIKYLGFISIFTLIFFNNFYYYDFFKKKNQIRTTYLIEGVSNSIDLMKRMDNNQINLLTFSPELMVWSTINGIENMYH